MMNYHTPTASFTRPANTTAYADGDLVANSATAGSVTPLSFDVSPLGQRRGKITRVRMYKSAVSPTLATFTLHLLTGSPTVAGGDNAALSITSSMLQYLGSIAIDMATGAEAGAAAGLVDVAAVSPAIVFQLDSSTPTLYGLIEADAAYVPASAEVFQVWLEIEV